jgi:hypothetical protein
MYTISLSSSLKTKLIGAVLIVFVLMATGVFGAFWRAIGSPSGDQFLYGYGYGDEGYGYGYGYAVDEGPYEAGCYAEDFVEGKWCLPKEGGEEPLVCDPGRYDDGWSCQLCSAWTYQSDFDAKSCNLCPAWTYQANEGATSCNACPAWTYQNNEGATMCIPQSTWGGSWGGWWVYINTPWLSTPAVNTIVNSFLTKNSHRTAAQKQAVVQKLVMLYNEIVKRDVASPELMNLFKQIILQIMLAWK